MQLETSAEDRPDDCAERSVQGAANRKAKAGMSERRGDGATLQLQRNARTTPVLSPLHKSPAALHHSVWQSTAADPAPAADGGAQQIDRRSGG